MFLTSWAKSQRNFDGQQAVNYRVPTTVDSKVRADHGGHIPKRLHQTGSYVYVFAPVPPDPPPLLFAAPRGGLTKASEDPIGPWRGIDVEGGTLLEMPMTSTSSGGVHSGLDARFFLFALRDLTNETKEGDQASKLAMGFKTILLSES